VRVNPDEFAADEWPERSLFRGSGSMMYPEGELKNTWDGLGTAGPAAECLISETEVRLRPKKVIRAIFEWPELVLPRDEIRGVEKGLFGRFRFRSDNKLLDGACFSPVASRAAFVASLNALGIPHIDLSRRERIALELSTIRNAMPPSRRLTRRRVKRERERLQEGGGGLELK
jgi:hypothetical protein